MILVLVLCSCKKDATRPANRKTLQLSEFAAMLSKEKSYSVTKYYTSGAELEIPRVNKEDTYTFDEGISDGWVSSKEPCIEYHYIIRIFNSGNDILFDWLDFNISPTTFTVEDYEDGKYFLLRSGDVYTRYEVTHSQSIN